MDIPVAEMNYNSFFFYFSGNPLNMLYNFELFEISGWGLKEKKKLLGKHVKRYEKIVGLGNFFFLLFSLLIKFVDCFVLSDGWRFNEMDCHNMRNLYWKWKIFQSFFYKQIRLTDLLDLSKVPVTSVRLTNSKSLYPRKERSFFLLWTILFTLGHSQIT